ncbi:MAG: hypothetical protein H0V81_02870 [Solirubrobacterales bacterium]|nr:hypothetical protein [Solirubrobacterales bacterium]
MNVIDLVWMRDDAPYMPVVAQGLLAVLAGPDPGARMWWDGEALRLETHLDLTELGETVLVAPLPDLTRVAWPTRNPQALGPSLAAAPDSDPQGVYRDLLGSASGAELLLLRAIATDQVLDDRGVPARTRLLRGTKSDLSAFSPLRRTTAAALSEELRDGPDFLPGKSGTMLGLVPEVQTFGGTTGREASGVGAESALLARLLRHGILALPPTSAIRRGRRDVGGPLVSDDRDLSWPRWTFPCDARSLRVLYGLAMVHEASPTRERLAAAGIDGVFRATPQALSTTVSVFRWGRRVA